MAETQDDATPIPDRHDEPRPRVSVLRVFLAVLLVIPHYLWGFVNADLIPMHGPRNLADHWVHALVAVGVPLSVMVLIVVHEYRKRSRVEAAIILIICCILTFLNLGCYGVLFAVGFG